MKNTARILRNRRHLFHLLHTMHPKVSIEQHAGKLVIKCNRQMIIQVIFSTVQLIDLWKKEFRSSPSFFSHVHVA